VAYTQQMSGPHQQQHNFGPGPETMPYGHGGMGPMGVGMGPGPAMGPPRQQRPQMMSPPTSYHNGNQANYGPAYGPGYGPGADVGQQRQQQHYPLPGQVSAQGMPAMGMGMGMNGYRPQSPAMAVAMAPPGQIPPHQGRSTPQGEMPYHGQAF
jgi:CCR4-NOT transcriptional complex subunit CAF120